MDLCECTTDRFDLKLDLKFSIGKCVTDIATSSLLVLVVVVLLSSEAPSGFSIVTVFSSPPAAAAAALLRLDGAVRIGFSTTDFSSLLLLPRRLPR